MYYYHVWVSSQQYHSEAPLTYESEADLHKGTVVIVFLKNKKVPAVVIGRTKKPDFKTKPFVRILENVIIPNELLELTSWLKSYYPAPFGQIISLIVPTFLVNTPADNNDLASNPTSQSPKLPSLTSHQQKAFDVISQTASKMHLVHGDTGSGKTRLYVELIKHSFDNGSSVLLLTPEIGLTSQLVSQIDEAFPGQTILLHSQQTPAVRRKHWLQIAKLDSPRIVIGPRSALFTPLKNIGFVILDEFHDRAYKQEQTPYYVASRVAAKLAGQHQAKVVLGSATPPIVDYYAFEQKQLPILRLAGTAMRSAHTTATEIIDASNRDNFVRSTILSELLLQQVENNLALKTQTLLFLNRRGSARIVLCQSCGWQDDCPRCDIPLTYHGDSHSMQCHTCGYTKQSRSSCPICHSTEIIFKSVGTKAIISELHKLFPKANVIRFDSDNLKSETLFENYQKVKKGDLDIIVGTQMVSKGLDLPKLSTVGVINADTSLNFPDYTAEETAFQTLSQIIGRAGRGHRDTTVIIQTYQPNNPILHSAITRDYEAFYRLQLKSRKDYEFPPFVYLLKITVQRKSGKTASKVCGEVIDKIRSLSVPVEISDPHPSFKEKVNNMINWQVVVKAKQRKYLIEIIHSLPSKVKYDIDPVDLL